MTAMQVSLIQKLMAFEALTLAVASSVHLIGGSYDAGVAEGLICIALLIGLLGQSWSDPNWFVVFSVCTIGWLVGTVVGGLCWTLRRKRGAA